MSTTCHDHPRTGGGDAADAGPDHQDESGRLLREATARGPEARRRAEDDAVETHLGLAHGLGRRYRGRGVSDDDLDQVAGLALVKAARRFDAGRGSFGAYAVPTILGELRRHFRDRAWTVRPPRRLQEVQAAINAGRDELRATGDHEPTSAELARHLDLPLADVREAGAVHGAYAPRSLDAPAPGADRPFGEGLGAPDTDLAHVERLQAVAPAIRSLDLEDRTLLHHRYVEDRTQADIGRELGISQMQVSRRLTAVVGRVRAAMGPA